MRVDFDTPLGKIKMMHAINQPPVCGMDVSAMRFLEQAGLPYSRLHDMGMNRVYPCIDIQCIFPDFEADETNPASYKFALSDHIILHLVKTGCKPYYNLAPTIENAVGAGFEPLYIHKPKDFHKWARICEHIIAHYNEGWADGHRLGIRYWEIWNEPDFGDPSCHFANHQCIGTKEEYFELYTITAKHLKARFGDSIWVGGYGAVGPYAILDKPEQYGIPAEHYLKTTPENDYRLQFISDFLAYIRQSGAPLDFFTWHSYDNVERTWYKGLYMRKILDQYGFADCEMHLNEWNNAVSDRRGSASACAKAAAMMIRMQDSPNDMLMYYDGRISRSRYAGMFNPITWEPFCLFYAFKAFNELYGMGTQVECDSECDEVYALAATDGKRRGILLTNLGEPTTLAVPEGFAVYRIDEEHPLSSDGMTDGQLSVNQYQTILLLHE